MREKLFHRDFTLVVIGQIISLLGNAVLRFVLPLYLLDVTGSRSLFGLCSAAAFVPMVVLTPLGGVVADRLHKQRIMVVLDFFTCALVALTALALGHLPLVPVLVGEKDALTELGQAERTESGGLKLLPPSVDSSQGIWVKVSPDGTLTEVTDPASLSGHRWAWKYPDHQGKMGLHLIRGTVRNVPGEDYYLTELKGAVRFSHVDFSYVPGKRILKDVTVYANPGQKIAFVGSTGAGKTTITNLINRFYEIEGGLITYDGIDVKAIRKDDLRRSLGAVLQDTHLFTGTIMDNIRYGRLDATDEECVAAAKSANAHSFIRRLPDGYQTMVTGDGANLSQGQRQLLAIARAAVADPPVLILDEATSSIDTRTEQLVQQGMDGLMYGRTSFVIAHRLSTVRNSDCIMVLELGHIIERGSHDELIAQKGRYYTLYTGNFAEDS